ncbi:hypothetical protein [Pelagicoccus sp. SDUM812002]|uniref:hypothetical protein n=1 Tax=Pelagicoccus sp. SDUM812002 TaxID=3041266 RepID=UPI00280C780B|nr:hypothetical protein [Pelagicoccus sp. SDUM812002]MDQ8184233.1 hypothetical protein [Pelagicoccus sp. SDUM812002]
MSYEINWNSNYVSFDYFGEVTPEDIVESNKEVYGDERFDDLRWELVSFDKADSVSFEPKQVRIIAYMDEAAAISNPRITVAFIGHTKILEAVEAAYETSRAQQCWAILHFESQEEALAHIEDSKGCSPSR